METTTATESRRLVNCYPTARLVSDFGHSYLQLAAGCDGSPEATFHRLPAYGPEWIGVTIVDVHTGERWFVPR